MFERRGRAAGDAVRSRSSPSTARYRARRLDLPVADPCLPRRRSPPARIPTSTRSRTSSGATAAASGSSSTARRSARFAPPERAARSWTRSSTLNAEHLGTEAVTVFEALDDAGLVTAAVNFTCYRGRTEHRATLPGFTRPVLGPRRFFFYNLFESDETGAPLAWRNRPGGHDRRLRGRGRPLARHPRRLRLPRLLPLRLRLRVARARPGRRARRARATATRRSATLIEAAGGPGRVPRALRSHRLLRPRADGGDAGGDARGARTAGVAGRARRAICASNRAGQVYRLPLCREDDGELAERLDGRSGGRRRALPRGRRGGRPP